MYGYKVEEFLNKWEQTHAIIKNHNLSIGLICEEILREFLRQSLPNRIGVVQGFVCENRCLSQQCDIIIYDSLNYAPLSTFGDIHIIPSEAVFSVIEVKSSLNFSGFSSALSAFERLRAMRVLKTYLFAYHLPKSSTLQSWFFKYASRDMDKTDDDWLCGENVIDKPDVENYPFAIIGLNNYSYFQKGHVQTRNYDMIGYNNYEIYNTDNQKTSCLQNFLADIINDSLVSEKPYEWTDMITDLTAISYISKNGGFGLCNL